MKSTIEFDGIDAMRFVTIEAHAQAQTGLAIEGNTGSASKRVGLIHVNVSWAYTAPTLLVTIDTPLGMGTAVKELTDFINSTA